MMGRIVDMKLSEKIRNFRTDRPSEWMMDEYMRDAKKLEAQLDKVMEVYKKWDNAEAFEYLRNPAGLLNELEAILDKK